MMLFRRFLVLLAASGLLFLSGCSRREDPTVAARRLFDQIAAGKAQEAYASAAFAFQAQQTNKAFEANLKDQGVSEYASAEIVPEEVGRRSAKLRVDMKTKAGAEMPLSVTLVYETGAWRLFSLRLINNAENRFSLVGKVPAFGDPVSRSMPEEPEIRRLVGETLRRFSDAIQEKSFKAFYASVSNAWHEQLTEGKLSRAFAPFIERNVDLSGIFKVEPVVNPPSMNSDGLLIVTGYYPTEPYRTSFLLKFIYELPNWKLFGIDVALQKPVAAGPAKP